MSLKLKRSEAFVGNEWVASKSGRTFDVFNPFDNSKITNVPNMDAGDANNAIDVAAKAFKTWRRTSPMERSQLLRRLGDLIKENWDELAALLVEENGKPLVEAKIEVNQGAETLHWFAEEARRVDGQVIASPDPEAHLMAVREAVGVAALITPWNFPFVLIARKIGPALAVGCTCVLKPAEDTPLVALAIAALAEKAGFPKGVFNVVTADRDNAADVGRALCESEAVGALSFTGSSRVGKILYRQCAGTMKKLGMELGGMGPFIVFESADIEKAIDGLLGIKFLNNGQVCISANRVLVQASIYDAFVAKVVAKVKESRVLGSGMDPKVTQGPLINATQFDRVVKLVDDAKAKGANILHGGSKSSVGKLHFEPTVITNVKKDMKAYQEEIFGPILPFVKFDTEQEALEIANETRFGLAGYFYSTDVNQCFRVSRAMEQGMVYVNNTTLVCVEAPFGGVKESGLGVEGGKYGIEEFTDLKYIAFKTN